MIFTLLLICFSHWRIPRTDHCLQFIKQYRRTRARTQHTHPVKLTRFALHVQPLANPADRDHCLQYMTAVGLLFGELKAEHYEDHFAADPRIDQLRQKMKVRA